MVTLNLLTILPVVDIVLHPRQKVFSILPIQNPQHTFVTFYLSSTPHTTTKKQKTKNFEKTSEYNILHHYFFQNSQNLISSKSCGKKMKFKIKTILWLIRFAHSRGFCMGRMEKIFLLDRTLYQLL